MKDQVDEVRVHNFNIAVVLAGEDSYWICELISKKPLAPGWKATKCYWLYPYEGDIQRFASVKGFEPTDSVFEIIRSEFSQVHSHATIAVDVTVKNVSIGSEHFGFVPLGEIRRLEEAYATFTKREIKNSADSEKAKEKEGGRDEEKKQEKREEVKAEKRREEKLPTQQKDPQPTIRVKETLREKKIVPIQQERPRREANRSTPQSITPTFVSASVMNKGNHCSTEAFHWKSYFIAFKGNRAFVAPSQSDIKYGFSVSSVSVGNTSVFLLFETPFNSSESFINDSTAVLPVKHVGVFGGDTQEEGRVLVLYAPAARGHKRPRESTHTGANVPDGTTRSSNAQMDDGVAARGESGLSLVGFNRWTDARGSAPSVKEVSSQQPLTGGGGGSGLRTAVFEDGIAVTYSSETATKFITPTEDKKTKKAGSNIGGNTPADNEMRELLENIQMAKKRANK
ncbi:hypothetical protein ADEAN_000385300 [Angomonas deanei]|uniref:Uncharacterized protein n=1 Tax=Angomonas deanei TaxID=59799 RepID=A0A7G2CBE1_9TRYP|nr:hypothetical protein ADEAN_000385300 [Angomonas deanei]